MGTSPTNEWMFNYRTFAREESDSDGETMEPKMSAESKLCSDLDLSSRTDEAVYKPNPFSIAKINATSRSRTTLPPEAAVGNSTLPLKKSGPLERCFNKSRQRVRQGGASCVPKEDISTRLAQPLELPPTKATPSSRTTSSDPVPSSKPFDPVVRHAVAQGPRLQAPGLLSDAHISTKYPDTNITGHNLRLVTSAAPALPNECVRRLEVVPFTAPSSSRYGPKTHESSLPFATQQPAQCPNPLKDAPTIDDVQPLTKTRLVGQERQIPLATRYMELGSTPQNTWSSISVAPRTRSPLPDPSTGMSACSSKKLVDIENAKSGSVTPRPPIRREFLSRQKDTKYTSVSLGPSEAHQRLHLSKPPQCYDDKEDEDETWSTLPRKKFKPSVRPTPRNKNSGPFRLPGLNLKANADPVTPAPRVVTFLPTPLLPKNQTDEGKTVFQNGTQRSSSPQTSPDSRQIFDLDEHYRSSSPPTSDAVQVEGDICINWDPQDVRKRYGRVVEIIEEHRSSKDLIWDLLGLPGRYYVRHNSEGAGSDLSIVKWPLQH